MARTVHHASARGGPAAVRAYWNTRIHDAAVTPHPVGSPEFFDDLEAYRYEKLDYLPRLVDFSAHTRRAVLEVGCGAGIDLARFAEGGARVAGVDVSDAAIALARRHFAARRLVGTLQVADGTALPFADESFDVVYCHGVLPYAADPGGIVREAHRVLRPTGEAIFMAYNRHSWLAWLSRVTGVGLEHDDAPVFDLVTRSEFDGLLTVFPVRRVMTERFPVRSRLHGGLKGALYNRLMVPVTRAVPRSWMRHWGWHLMAFCRKAP